MILYMYDSCTLYMNNVGSGRLVREACTRLNVCRLQPIKMKEISLLNIWRHVYDTFLYVFFFLLHNVTCVKVKSI